MSYQIPSTTKAEVISGEGKFPMYRLKPTKNVKLQNIIVTMFLKGQIAEDFKMRINVYKDKNGQNVLIQSTTVNNLDIARVGDYYCEIRFDFGAANNRMAIGIEHLIEFEVYDGYVYDSLNYLALIMDTQASMAYLGSDANPLPTSDANNYGHRISVFLGEIETQSDEKFFMVKMEGAKLLNGLTEETIYDVNKKLYEADIQQSLFIDMTDLDSFMLTTSTDEFSLSRVYDPIVPNPMDYTEGLDTYYYDPTTGHFQFYTEHWISNGFTAILKYFLFFTEFKGRYADPYMNELSDVVYWQPRLRDGLEFDFSQQNNFNGVLSIASSPVSLKNQDRYMNTFFSPNDSFSNREIKIWRCEGSVLNFDLEFVGTIREASIDDDNCTIQIEDILSTLDRTYDDGLKTYYEELSYATDLIREDDRRKIIPRLYGRRGPFETFKLDTQQEFASGHTYKIDALNGDKMTELTNVSYSDTVANNTNRTWSIGFGPGLDTSELFDCTLHTHLVLSSFEASILTLTPPAGFAVNDIFAVGDSFKNGTQYGTVYAVSPTQIYVWPYNAAYSAANDVLRGRVGALVIKRGDELFYPVIDRDYTCDVGVDFDIKITFNNNFEANHVGLVALDPNECEVFGRLYYNESTGAATDIIKAFVEYAGFNTAADFCPAQNPAVPDAYSGMSYPDPVLSFTVPFVGENSMPSYRDVLELLLKTTMGFVYFDQSGNMRFKSFLDGIHLPGPLETVDDDFYITNESGKDPIDDGINQKKSTEFAVQFDLYDLFSGVEFNFSHNPNGFDVSEQSFGTMNNGLDGVKRFYKTNKKYQVECLADNVASKFNNYISKYVKLVCGRRASYSLRAFTTYGIYLGDDLLVSRAKILGSDNSSFMRVVSISKASDSQKLTMLDLKRFPFS